MDRMSILFFVLVMIAAAYLVFRGLIALRAYVMFRGKRLVTCPENKQTVAVEVNARKVATESFAGITHLRLKDCSRWPEKKDCGQDCLSEVEADPEACLIWNIVNRWYEGKACAFCGKMFGQINWHEHRPALLAPLVPGLSHRESLPNQSTAHYKTMQWTDVAPEKLPEILATYKPVCWDCHVAESFRREHPDLITDRAPH